METLFNTQNIKIIEEKPIRTLPDNVAKISVIGVGGAGCNMVDHMISEGVNYRINMAVANTDLQSLQISKAPTKIQIGVQLTRGLGAGMKPEVGRDAANENYEDIKTALTGSDIVFVASGLGGGTGTGAAAVVASAAKEVGALTVSVATKPFAWEGKQRAALANLGLEELRKVSDSIIIIQNDKLLNIIEQSTGMKDAFKMVDNVLYQAVVGMSEVILNPGNNDINTDFADIRTIMQHKGLALMGIGIGRGEDAAIKALENAVNSPLMDNMSLSGAKGVLIHFRISPQVSMFAISSVMNLVHDKVDDYAEVIFGTTSDKQLSIDEVQITIIATGFNINSDSTSNEAIAASQNNGANIVKKLEEVVQNAPKTTKDNENYLDTPPLMRNYSIKFPLA